MDRPRINIVPSQYAVWVSHGIRLETPMDMTQREWEMLRQYVEDVIKPEQPAQPVR
jgi:hypothetical protein